MTPGEFIVWLDEFLGWLWWGLMNPMSEVYQYLLAAVIVLGLPCYLLWRIIRWLVRKKI